MTTKKIIASIGTTILFAGGGTIGLDAAQNPYTDKGQTLEITAQSSLPEGGQTKNIVSKNEPAITLSKWNGEVALKVKSLDLPTNSTGARAFLSDKVEWGTGNVKMEAVPLASSPGIEDGGMEINLILDSVPASNVFNFQLENWENLDFFEQKPLWKEAGLKAPTDKCTDTDCDTGDGQSHRPDNVVNSFAVYYKNHANHKVGDTNYATGKAYHIFRPLVTDAKGVSVWAVLSYINGVLTVTVPQEFLDGAVYPVKVDPSFGYLTVGGTALARTSTNSDRASIFAASQYTAITGDKIVQTSVYAQCTVSGSGSLGQSAYTFSGGVPVTRVITEQTLTINSTAAAWYNSAALTTSLTASTVYVSAIGNFSQGTCTAMNVFLDSVGVSENSLNAAGALPSTWTQTSTDANDFSHYVTYQQCNSSISTCTDTFTKTGTDVWIAPAGVTSVTAACWAGGGAGQLSIGGQAGGGGGGAYAASTVSVTPGTSYTVVVGTGGSSSGISGGNSSFNSSSVVAAGGTGSTGGAGGAGGTTAASTGTTKFAGGTGGTGAISNGSGGSGGGAGPDGAGLNGVTATSSNGGAGGFGDNGFGSSGGAGGIPTVVLAGNGVNNSSGAGGGGGAGLQVGTFGGNGGLPGGGGGGSTNSGSTAGTGGGGQCKITYTSAAASTNTFTTGTLQNATGFIDGATGYIQ